MTALEYCIKYDFVAALNDKEHGKSEKEEFKAFERVVFLLLSISKKKINRLVKLSSNKIFFR